ncbi:MAG: hypothetical protein ACE5H8_02665 [Alphaproteobacteria bacterium]
MIPFSLKQLAYFVAAGERDSVTAVLRATRMATACAEFCREHFAATRVMAG